MKLKLNYKNTFVIGLAFFSILMLWQVYNNYCSLILEQLLKKQFNDENHGLYIIGIIMASDNIFALFMLPLFGRLSDKTKTRFGKRMPYIITGMLLSAVAFPFIAVFYEMNSLIGVILMMFVTLVLMHMYRSPAVSLMPDITPKPLRSAANGVINLVGYIGAILGAGLGMISFLQYNNNPVIAFSIVSLFLIVAAAILHFNINENSLVRMSQDDLAIGEKYSTAAETQVDDAPLSKNAKKNLLFLFVATFFWYASFNAVETFLSIYTNRLYGGQGPSATAVAILTISSIITFIPGGKLSLRIGRKKSIVIGLCLLIGAFAVGGLNLGASLTNPNPIYLYVISIFAGIGWALVNVNSYPMVVEQCSQKNIGKFTGKYYFYSMLSQSFTPIAIGYIMSFYATEKILFIYSAVFMIISLVLFMFVKEKHIKVVSTKKSNIEFLDVD